MRRRRYGVGTRRAFTLQMHDNTVECLDPHRCGLTCHCGEEVQGHTARENHMAVPMTCAVCEITMFWPNPPAAESGAVRFVRDQIMIYQGGEWTKLADTKGSPPFDLPPFTSAQRNAIPTPVDGMMIANVDRGCNQVFVGGCWEDAGMRKFVVNALKPSIFSTGNRDDMVDSLVHQFGRPFKK